MIIDFHQHYLPHRPNYPGETRQSWLYDGSRVQGYRDVPALLADMDAAGVDQVVWQGEYFLHAENCLERNRRVSNARRMNPTRLHAYASIQPAHPDAIDHIKQSIQAGFVGVGELNPAAQGFSLRDPAVIRVVSFCAQSNIPMLFHVNEPVGPAYMGKVMIPLHMFYECAARFPELTIILAHWGGGLWWYEQIPTVKQVLRNVWYDTASAFFTYPDTTVMAQLAGLVIPHKVLYGSDYPLRPEKYPDDWLCRWTNSMIQSSPALLRDAWMGGSAMQVLNRTAEPPTSVQPLLPALNLATPLVVVAEQWPDQLATLANWNVRYSESTPWWQTVAHTLSESGHGPEVQARVLKAITEGLPH